MQRVNWFFKVEFDYKWNLFFPEKTNYMCRCVKVETRLYL